MYTTDPESNTVRWGCVDLDTQDPGMVYQLLAELPEPYVLERTGGNGRHVWVLVQEPVDAQSMRVYLRSLCRLAGLPDSVEVFPKQLAPLKSGEVGNLVRLPFGRSGKTGGWSTVEAGHWRFAQWPPGRSPAEAPSRAQVAREQVARTEGRAITSVPSERAQWLEELWAGGHGEGRNNSLYRLAGWLRSRGFPEYAVEANVNLANAGFSPPLDQEELDKILRRR